MHPARPAEETTPEQSHCQGHGALRSTPAPEPPAHTAHALLLHSTWLQPLLSPPPLAQVLTRGYVAKTGQHSVKMDMKPRFPPWVLGPRSGTSTFC